MKVNLTRNLQNLISDDQIKLNEHDLKVNVENLPKVSKVTQEIFKNKVESASTEGTSIGDVLAIQDRSKNLKNRCTDISKLDPSYMKKRKIIACMTLALHVACVAALILTLAFAAAFPPLFFVLTPTILILIHVAICFLNARKHPDQNKMDYTGVKKALCLGHLDVPLIEINRIKNDQIKISDSSVAQLSVDYEAIQKDIERSLTMFDEDKVQFKGKYEKKIDQHQKGVIENYEKQIEDLNKIMKEKRIKKNSMEDELKRLGNKLKHPDSIQSLFQSLFLSSYLKDDKEIALGKAKVELRSLRKEKDRLFESLKEVREKQPEEKAQALKDLDTVFEYYNQLKETLKK